MRRVLRLAPCLVLLLPVGCGGGSGGSDTRTVLVDFTHDEMVTSMIDFFPETVTVHPGDTVRFKQFWTGEAHNVTFGTAFNDALGRIRSRLARKTRPTIQEIETDVAQLAGLPVILGGARGPFVVDQNGAQPCYLDRGLPPSDPDTPCPQRAKPRFNGRHSYYSSGFIPQEGKGSNLFTLELAPDIAPGDYNFYCTLHGVGQSGTLKVVPADREIESQGAVDRRARADIEREFATPFRQALQVAERGGVEVAGKPYATPLAGVATTGIRSWAGVVHQRHPEHRHGSVNQFVPERITARVGETVTWTFTGRHTVSFNVPEFFSSFTVADSGKVTMNPDAYRALGFPGRPADLPADRVANIDGGVWDGEGFVSSGLNWQAGDRFSLAFARPGSYLMACLIHPAMVGRVEVKA